MVFTKEASPPRQWCQLAQDVSVLISDQQQEDDFHTILQRVDKSWSDSERKELSELFGGKKRKGAPISGIKCFLAAFEGEKSDVNLLLVCRVFDAVFRVILDEGDRKREKMIIKADAIATICRVTRKRLLMRIEASNKPMDLRIEQLLFKLLFDIGQKDSKFNLKVRMSGIVATMSRYFVKFDYLVDTFYPLFVKASRSPRNGQMIGRQEGLMVKLMAKINYLNNSEHLDQIQLLDKHLQLLYFTLKNRRTRNLMIRDQFCRNLVDILKKHLSASSLAAASRPSRLLSSIFGTSDNSQSTLAAHCETVFGTLAILRLLANNKKARDELISLGTMEICAKELKETQESESKTGIKAKIEDSLCALCLRCMPSVVYPLDNVKFPLEFPLPQTQPTLGGRVRNSSSINISFDNGKSSDEDGIDEEDEAFNDQNVSSNFEHSDDEENEKVNLPLPKTLKLTPTQLNKYTPFFAEMEKGTIGDIGRYQGESEEEDWRACCERTKYCMPIRQLLPLEMFSGNEKNQKEKLQKCSNSMKKMIVEELGKTSMRQSSSKGSVVYDLDAIVFEQSSRINDVSSLNLVGKFDSNQGLVFESRFESGNLRRATLVSQTHYELILTPDINQLRDHYQWFFFQVSNMRKGVNYTFEIVNCLKSTSMYSQGMQPVMFSTIDSTLGWKRSGENVCYYRNLYGNDSGNGEDKNGDEKKKKHYYSIRFDINFQNTGDVCYVAYHYPYTYSFLNTSLLSLRKLQLTAVYCREDVIGHSLAGNPMKMLTITSPSSSQEISTKPVIVLSARVHPGESNSSWIMQGILESLICGSWSEMYRLRENFVFKVIPMLNPDGVINGSHRCSLSGIDLNRVWDRPNESLHPEIYNSKAIIQYLCEALNKKPYAYVDLHGHSKKWDFFLFGNNSAESWRKEDVQEGKDEEEYLVLPRAMEQTCVGKFNSSECRFNITQGKESSARVNIWRQFGVSTAYTLECTYCGFQMAPNKGYQINIEDLKQIGRDLLHSLLEMGTKP